MYKVIKNSPNNLKAIKVIMFKNNGVFPFAVGLCKRDGSPNRCAMRLIGLTDTGMFIIEFASRGKKDTVNTNRLTIKMEA